MTNDQLLNHHPEPIVCNGCGNSGAILWLALGSATEARREFAGLQGEFYERVSRKHPYPIELVCNCCGGIVQKSGQCEAREKYVEYLNSSREAQLYSRSVTNEPMRWLWLDLASKYEELANYFARKSRMGT